MTSYEVRATNGTPCVCRDGRGHHMPVREVSAVEWTHFANPPALDMRLYETREVDKPPPADMEVAEEILAEAKRRHVLELEKREMSEGRYPAVCLAMLIDAVKSELKGQESLDQVNRRLKERSKLEEAGKKDEAAKISRSRKRAPVEKKELSKK